MFGQTDTIRMARDLGAHAAQRQALMARNVANADTPGYRARDMESFSSVLRDGAPQPMRATDPRHVAGGWAAAGRSVDAGGEMAPNGNAVSIEDEMVRGADIRRSFDLSVAVYRAGMALTRTALGRG